MFIVSGVVEKEGGSLYCSVVWVHPEKGLVGKRRKVRNDLPICIYREYVADDWAQ